MAGYDHSLYRMYLAGVPMFARCSTAQLDLVAALGEADSYRPGQDIVREGDEGGGGFFVITGGRARVRRDDHDVAELGTGDYFGELSLFDPAPRNATVTAIDTVTCVVLSPDAFRRRSTRSPRCATRCCTGWPAGSTSSTSGTESRGRQVGAAERGSPLHPSSWKSVDRRTVSAARVEPERRDPGPTGRSAGLHVRGRTSCPPPPDRW